MDKSKLESHEPFVLIEKDGLVMRYQGTVHKLETLEELEALSKASGKKIAFALPFCLIRQRGKEYAAHGDEPIIAVEVFDEVKYARHQLREVLANTTIEVEGGITPSVDDDSFERQVEDVQERIAEGEICQAIISRRFEGKFKDYSPEQLQELYRRLLEQRGQYMTILFHTNETSLVGASPERHLEISGEKVVMNPIAGTLPKGDLEDFEERLIEFLEDKKEINELYQVLDEELKMMARNCPKGGKISGPSLRETGVVIHTEYLLEGLDGVKATRALRNTLHAATLVGGPLPRASRMIYEHETDSRRYYGGEIGVLEPNGDLDSAIAIRVAEVFPDGHFAVQAGAGIVCDSVPKKEAIETKMKANGALKAITGGAKQTEVRYLDQVDQTRVNELLQRRNEFLSHFHLDEQSELPPVEELTGKKIVIVNNEDDFAYMLGHMAQKMGCEVEVVDTFIFDPENPGGDIVILGPGPGDINDEDDERMQKLLSHVDILGENDFPTLGICLGHQAVAKQRGMSVEKRDFPTQGMQKEIDLYGKRERVGFYNSYVVRGDNPKFECSKDDEGEVTAMRIKNMIGYQFHPESVMTQNGYKLLREAFLRLVGGEKG